MRCAWVATALSLLVSAPALAGRPTHFVPQSEGDAEQVLVALSQTTGSGPDDRKARAQLLMRVHYALASGKSYTVIQQQTPGVLRTLWPKLSPKEWGVALATLAELGTKDSLSLLSEKLLAPKKWPDEAATGLERIDLKNPAVPQLFPGLGEAIAFDDARALAVLDLANRLVQSNALQKHPAATHLDVLERWVGANDVSRAVSACYALAFIRGERANWILEKASKHADKWVRLEAAYARASHRLPGATEAMAEAVLDPETSQRARSYLHAFNLDHRVPKEAEEPHFKAKATMVNWLMHPDEFGRAPDRIELWDERTIFWPPTKDKRTLYLFKYGYDRKDGAYEGVGMVGSLTFSLEETHLPRTPREAYVRHCAVELAFQRDEELEAHAHDLKLCRKRLEFSGGSRK